MLDIEQKHVPELFFNSVRECGDMPFMGWKENGNWKTISWNEGEKKVTRFALGLISLGIKKEDHVAIFSPNRPEWGIADIAILSVAKADIPVYPTNSAVETEYILNDSGSIAIIVAEKEHLDRVLEIKDKVPTLNHIITMDKIEGVDDSILHFDDVMALGDAYADKEELSRRIEATNTDDMATLIYTSGTTGPPKGVMLTHRNFLSNLFQAYKSHEDVFERGQTGLSFLPLSHSLERTVGWYLVVYLGGTVYYAEGPTTVVDDLKEIRPHFLVSVPRLFEKIHSAIHEKVSQASPLKQALFNWAVGTGRAASQYITQKKDLHFWLGFQYKFAKKLVLDKIKNGLGADRIVTFVSGGGPLAQEINEFFHGLGLIVHEGYGLTETTPIVTANTFNDFRFGSVGKTVLDTEIKIAEDGEILIRGPQVMKGYYNKPEATKEAIDDEGWFYSGDIGVIEDGFLKITDRKKELIITAGGKNISPANIENSMIIDRYIENLVAIGDGLPFISALVVPEFEALEYWAEQNGIKYSNNKELVENPKVIKLFEERIAKHNEQFARVEQIKKFILVDHSFSQETGELTPTMKLKRKIINNKYNGVIENMYK